MKKLRKYKKKLINRVQLFLILFSSLWIFMSCKTPTTIEGVFNECHISNIEGITNISIIVHNNDIKNIFIPISFWDLDGFAVGNGWYFFSFDTFLYNQIVFFQAEYMDPGFREYSYYNLTNNCFPKFVKLKPKESLKISLNVENFRDSLCKNTIYRFIITTPYVNEEALEIMTSILGVKYENILLDLKEISISQKYWTVRRVSGNSFGFNTHCSEHILTGSEFEGIHTTGILSTKCTGFLRNE